MDILWVKDAPFWQKMYFIGIIVGVAFFIYYLLEAIIVVKKDFKNWMKTRKQ